MKALTNRVGTYVTGDGVADAVLSYALALARARQLDVVDIPFVAGGGEVARVKMMVGWMVDIDAVSHGRGDPELTDSALTDDLRAREGSLHAHGNTPLSADDLVSLDTIGEY
ncbi:hypothetical protein [Microbacterium sp.]|uniref:hypothetical protein n=1 Tax=Microbacterium sp. TaxID=51671 RepID=UPI002E33523C|nr:hypothetical protein [Microbacterium sp.]HEX5729441.1 hypothetical protein [Microbacterium sp.]